MPDILLRRDIRVNEGNAVVVATVKFKGANAGLGNDACQKAVHSMLRSEFLLEALPYFLSKLLDSVIAQFGNCPGGAIVGRAERS